MSQNYIEPDVLARYFAKESTAREASEVKQWVDAAPEHRQMFENIKQIWNHSSGRSDFEEKVFNTDRDWQQLKKKIDRLKTDEKASSSSKKPFDYSVSHHGFWPAFARVAAVLLLVGVIGIFAYQNWTPPQEGSTEPTLREISTAMGQRVNLTLSDGTSVLLNAGSTLRLPETFEDDKREVFLEGQAYFNVETNPARPFIIHSGTAQTEVLGTSFSVRAYPREQTITVAVEEGRVSFKVFNTTGELPVRLSRHELGRFNIPAGQVETQPIEDLALYLGWVDGYLKFKEAPLGDVAIELERRYGVEVTFQNEELKARSLTALLKSRSIQNVLDVISTSLNIDYQLHENEVIFQTSKT